MDSSDRMTSEVSHEQQGDDRHGEIWAFWKVCDKVWKHTDDGDPLKKSAESNWLWRRPSKV